MFIVSFVSHILHPSPTLARAQLRHLLGLTLPMPRFDPFQGVQRREWGLPWCLEGPTGSKHGENGMNMYV